MRGGSKGRRVNEALWSVWGYENLLKTMLYKWRVENIFCCCGFIPNEMCEMTHFYARVMRLSLIVERDGGWWELEVVPGARE
jgi:hypothetical protein